MQIVNRHYENAEVDFKFPDRICELLYKSDVSPEIVVSNDWKWFEDAGKEHIKEGGKFEVIFISFSSEPDKKPEYFEEYEDWSAVYKDSIKFGPNVFLGYILIKK